ncbi:purine phosphorylase [soil metagenome]
MKVLRRVVTRRGVYGAALPYEVAWHCTGPGAARIEGACAALAAAGAPRGCVVILAGCAGALSVGADAARAWAASVVLDDDGKRMTPPLVGAPALALIGVDRLLSTPAGKAELHARSGAAAVDMEAHAFARCGAAQGWRWGVVRGISDFSTERLPEGIEDWVSADGRTRGGRVAAALLRRPWLVARLIGLRRRTSGALEGAGVVLHTMIAAAAEAGRA